jgi:uncharacterized protein (DUF427 family)
VPPEDISIDLLQPSAGGTCCEWRREAQYFDLVLREARIHKVAWTYTDPPEKFDPLTGFLSFYPGKLACYLDGEQVRPQAGGFYGGWITNHLVGPFKGEPGSHGW